MEREPGTDAAAPGQDADRTEVDAAAPGEDPGDVDLDAIGADLADVEVALARLEDGSYWTDERTGDPLPDSLLDERPAARRTET